MQPFKRNIIPSHLLKNNTGSMSVEYVFCMVFAFSIMIGVILWFDVLTVDVVDQFESWVVDYPNN